jgi:hypothetical protein
MVVMGNAGNHVDVEVDVVHGARSVVGVAGRSDFITQSPGAILSALILFPGLIVKNGSTEKGYDRNPCLPGR